MVLLRTPLVLLVVWTAVRWSGLDAVTPLAQLVSYTPYAAAAAVLPVLLAGVLRRWCALAVGLAVLVALAVAVLPRAMPADRGRGVPDGAALRVLTVNLLYGEASAVAVVDLVRREHVDVLTTQELTSEGIAELDAAGLVTLLPHRVLRLRPEGGGSGVYARLQLADRGGLGRATTFEMAVAGLTYANRQIEVVAVHPMSPLPGGAVASWRRDLGLLPGPDPGDGLRLLVGDFNATLDHGALRRLLRRGYLDAADEVGAGLTPTWPSGRATALAAFDPPPVTIDHVLVERGVAVAAVRVHDVPGSDHRAVLADLRLTPRA